MSRRRARIGSYSGLAMLLAIFTLAGVVRTMAQTEHVLHNFGVRNKDGAEPLVTLVADQAGNLYGATQNGGGRGLHCFSDGCGTVFEISPPASAGGKWSETVLYAFREVNVDDGAYPASPLVIDNAGNLYGSTEEGGTNGQGIVFELSPPSAAGNPWTETILYNLETNGQIANRTPLLLDAEGNLYGESSGTPGDDGSIFELSPPSVAGGAWTYTLLYTFPISGLTGGYPTGGLVWDDSGNLYGVTYMDGDSACTVGGAGCGVVFELEKPSVAGGAWTYLMVHQFTGTDGDGLNPNAISFHNGAIYGTTAHGGVNSGGTIFELSPPTTHGAEAVETILFAFDTSNSYGSGPQWSVIFDRAGNLYTTTSYKQNILELSPPTEPGGAWTPQNVYTFTTPVGDISGVNFDNGKALYGTTLNGGTANKGVAFVVTP
jgi:uncharacterized repeat protein (TIGR03803 family)